MKCIFLDHDGVICLSNHWGGRTKKWAKYRSENPETSTNKMDAPVFVRFDDFDKKAVRILNQILEETGAEIVVSSDWKIFATVEELGEYFELHGISKKPIDRTLNMREFDEHGGSMYEYKGWRDRMRIVEIKKYLEDHPKITHWVAVDDMDMGNKAQQGYGLDNFVLTPRSNEGIKQVGIKDKILKFLK